ncbi:MAG: hypothetical protein HC902_12805, partial [Calothrix sp. SM1_5_4]|nr:hypothetical protein [Calothrix sp. SM1_5_4]
MRPLLLNQSGERVPRAWLEKWIKGLARELARRGHKGLSRGEIVLVFVKSAEMK